jgi:hypothetical protein
MNNNEKRSLNKKLAKILQIQKNENYAKYLANTERDPYIRPYAKYPYEKTNRIPLSPIELAKKQKKIKNLEEKYKIILDKSKNKIEKAKKLKQNENNEKLARSLVNPIRRPTAKYPYENNNEIELSPYMRNKLRRENQVRENYEFAQKLQRNDPLRKIRRFNGRYPYENNNEIELSPYEIAKRKKQIEENEKIAKYHNNIRRQEEENEKIARNLSKRNRN